MSNKSSGENQNPIIRQSLLNNNNVGRDININKIEQNITNNWHIPQANNLRPLNREIFKPLIENRITFFAGRYAVLTQITEFINKPIGGYLVITAPAGFGKTSLMAKLVIEAPENFAYHFFAPYENPNSITEEGFLRNVVEQMALWHGYANSFPEKLTDLQALYHSFLDKPLNSTHVLAIDGLDEVVNWKIAPYLSRRLPINLRIILTVRNVGQDLAVDYDFPNNQTEYLQLEGLTRDDVIQVMRKAGNGATVFAENTVLIEEVMRVSAYQEQPTLGADPFYVRWLAEDAASGHLTSANIAAQPKGLEKYLDKWWEEIKKLADSESIKVKKLAKPIQDLLGTLTTALGTIRRQDLEIINNSLVSDWAADFFDDILKTVRRFVIGNEERGYAIAHPRLRQYMRKKIRTEAYSSKLLDFCASWHEHYSSYALRYYGEHLRDAKKWDELYLLAQNQTFTDVQRQQLPNEPELALNNLRLALQTAAERDDAGNIAKFLLIHAKQFLAQESPLEALRTGSLDKAWKLADWCDIDNCILWYLLLAWELKDAGRLKELQATLKRLQGKDLCQFPGYANGSWQGDYIIEFLGHLFEVSEDICLILCRQILNDFHLTYLCNYFIKKSNFYIALKVVEEIKPEKQQIPVLINIAKAQANQADKEAATNTLLKALHAVRKLSNKNEYVFKMQSIAEVQVQELGDINAAVNTLTELIEIAETIPHQHQKVRVFIMIVHVQLEIGMLEEAIQTLYKVDSLPEKEIFLSDIAKAFYDAGEKENALAKLVIAKGLALKIKNKSEKVESLKNIATAQAQIKEFNAALETAEEIDDERCRDQTLEAIAMFQTDVEDLTSATTTISKIQDQSTKINAQWQVAQRQVELGKLNDALETAVNIECQSVHDDILVKIVTSQANLGDIDTALKNKNYIQNENEKVKALFAIAKGYAKLKNYEAACQMIDQINDEWYQSEALVDLVTVQSEAGDITAALKTKNKLQDKNRAQSSIAQAYAKVKNYNIGLDMIRKISAPHLRAKALESIANIQMQDGLSHEVKDTFSIQMKLEQRPKTSNLYIQAFTVAEIIELQINQGIKSHYLPSLKFVCDLVHKIEDSAERANILTKIASIFILEGDLQKARLFCDQALETTRSISKSRGDQRSQNFEFIAQIQAKTGEFEAAIETMQFIQFPSNQANVLVTIAQLQSTANAEQKEQWKKNITNIADTIFNNAVFLVIDSDVKFWATVAIAQYMIGDKESAFATFTNLLNAAQTLEFEEQNKNSSIVEAQRNLSIIAAGYAKAGETETALMITEKIKDATEKLKALWTITWNQLKKGEKVTTLAAALDARKKIIDEKKRLEALQVIAQIQAIARKGEEAVATAEAILTYRNWHLPGIASWLAETGDKVNFKRLLIPCTYYLDAVYEMCGCIAQMYPDQAEAVAKAVREV